jgi:hypothetical protein
VSGDIVIAYATLGTIVLGLAIRAWLKGTFGHRISDLTHDDIAVIGDPYEASVILTEAPGTTGVRAVHGEGL